MAFNLVVVVVVLAIGALLIWTSPILRAIVIDTIRHPNRSARFQSGDSGVVTVTPMDSRLLAEREEVTHLVISAAVRFTNRPTGATTANASVRTEVTKRELQPVH